MTGSTMGAAGVETPAAPRSAVATTALPERTADDLPGSSRSVAARTLARLGAWLEADPGDDDALLVKLDTFQRVLLLLLVTEYWCRGLVRWNDLGPLYSTSLAGVTALGLAGLYAPLRRVAFLGIGLMHVAVVHREFPAAGNHAYLEALLCGLSALLDLRSEADRRLYLRAVRWVIVVVFFTSGLQKMIHGYYFRGQYLAYAAWIPTFRPVLGLLLPEGELARLVSYGRGAGAGPFLVDSIPFLLAANGVYLGEMLAAVLLVNPRTRLLGVALAAGLLLVIEVAAREVFFGLLFLSGLGLFLPGARNRLLAIPTLVLLGIFLLVRAGLLPDATFY